MASAGPWSDGTSWMTGGTAGTMVSRALSTMSLTRYQSSASTYFEDSGPSAPRGSVFRARLDTSRLRRRCSPMLERWHRSPVGSRGSGRPRVRPHGSPGGAGSRGGRRSRGRASSGLFEVGRVVPLGQERDVRQAPPPPQPFARFQLGDGMPYLPHLRLGLASRPHEGGEVGRSIRRLDRGRIELGLARPQVARAPRFEWHRGDAVEDKLLSAAALQAGSEDVHRVAGIHRSGVWTPTTR
jgi:hypothetical protein